MICKPAIRRVAQVGDWIVGLGSARSPIGDVSGHVVYAMEVTRTMSMQEYDTFCRSSLRGKIPKWSSRDHRRRVGDCIYDYSRGPRPIIRPSVHGEQNRKTDLSGRKALLSEHFYYFGDRPRELPEELAAIVHQTQGHKSVANEKYAPMFVGWIEGLGVEPNRRRGKPQMQADIVGGEACAAACSARARKEDHRDTVRDC